ncbi:DUF305 domain-containing protein [Nonomuraea sp. LPB2021202275-12-8]|uniref:DUF305 domain-containing protein n=1 Tax=Nonomuraea sp. LPB2021202275-12-8 TaxID=3120159 RepID=UPI00300C7644
MRYVLAALGLLLVVACGPDESGGAPVNAADVTFVQMMVQHHRQGIQIAKVGADRATTPELKTLTAAIVTTQQSEVEMMLRWLHAWGQPLNAPDGAHDHHGGLPEIDQKRIAALKRSKELEPDLLTLMITHQEGAVQMAAAEVRDGVAPAATQWAAQVQESRKAQIAQMRELLSR